MMTLMARLCTLCAVCALMQLALGDSKQQAGLRMIGGMLMMHLVISGAHELGAQLMAADSLMAVYEILIG